jgi:hypothetical protein
VVEPSVFFDVLGVAATLLFPDAIVIFLQVEVGDFPSIGIEIGRPAKDRFWEGVDMDEVFSHNERDKEGVFIHNHGTAAAKSLDHGDVSFFDRFNMDMRFWLSRDPHDNRARRSLIDDAKVSLIRTQERFFQLKLLKDGCVF